MTQNKENKVEYWLQEDIISHSNNKPYGHKGDKVVIISDHENVLIVHAADGNSFLVPASCPRCNIVLEMNHVEAEAKGFKRKDIQ